MQLLKPGTRERNDMISKTSRVYINTLPAVKHLIDGVVVGIDPSIGSRSSQPGYAVYIAGELVESGTFRIPPEKHIHDRLRLLATHVRRLYNKYDPDVLVYEDIPASRYGGGNANSHSSLIKAVGAILSVPGPELCVGILPVSWKNEARSGYIKGDEEDAVELAYVVIKLARRIHDEKLTTSRQKKKKETGS